MWFTQKSFQWEMPEEIPWKIPDKRSAFGSRGIHGQLRLRLSVEYSDAVRKEGKERPGGRQEERRSRCLWYRHQLIWTYCLINSMNVSSASCCLPSTVCIPVFTIPPSIPPSFPPFIPSLIPSFLSSFPEATAWTTQDSARGKCNRRPSYKWFNSD